MFTSSPEGHLGLISHSLERLVRAIVCRVWWVVGGGGGSGDLGGGGGVTTRDVLCGDVRGLDGLDGLDCLGGDLVRAVGSPAVLCDDAE